MNQNFWKIIFYNSIVYFFYFLENYSLKFKWSESYNKGRVGQQNLEILKIFYYARNFSDVFNIYSLSGYEIKILHYVKKIFCKTVHF